ncbi:hypothetical protein ISO99_05075 [Staphylococcus sp. 18_1_E_LY]|uniref:Uncharacterized protein n=1 Tax=Staphylococcus lloydii TaxID=2781774 RepID=A0A7T1AYV8_9STAP|nr:hypothetical protein [Staphylococcus lloydii]MBF7019278.1 hypothetical protein [Staphylococcus lloydii]MBF7027006.1 hypothetical protein [Staphylococcus lloydii]MDU9417160.1 hypothetical protein [Staphylococcus lloydii]QPM74653.1 hypothetical protein ISP08_09935 [Staphylococcus lloydii]
MGTLFMYLAFMLFIVMLFLLILSGAMNFGNKKNVLFLVTIVVLIIGVVTLYEKGSNMRKHEIDALEYKG